MAEGLAGAFERGLCRNVGVSNFNAKQVRKISRFFSPCFHNVLFAGKVVL